MAALSIAALVGAGLFVKPAVENYFATLTPPKKIENFLVTDHKANMEEHGMCAATFHVMMNKQSLMGGPLFDVHGINHEQLLRPYVPGQNSDVNPASHAIDQHLHFFDFDRRDTLVGLHAMQGSIRPNRSQAIVTSLTPEVHHPNDPSRVSAFLATSYVPNFAHFSQIQRAREVATSDDPERSQRRNYGGVEFTRAPFQSFTYSQ